MPKLTIHDLFQAKREGRQFIEIRTSDVHEAVACAEALGKVPVEASDYPGFVSNRVLMPMINEAVYCLMEGVATKEAIDTVMKLGMNHPMGPLALADLIGLDTCLAIMETLYNGFNDSKYRPCPLLKKYAAYRFVRRFRASAAGSEEEFPGLFRRLKPRPAHRFFRDENCP